MKAEKYPSIILAICLMAGFVLRFVYLLQYSEFPLFDTPLGPDVEEYMSRTREILSGKILWDSPQIHAPLYPYFLAVLGFLSNDSHFWTRFAQSSLCLIASAPLVFLILSKKIIPRSSATIFSILVAVYPPAIYYQCEYFSESLLFALLMLSLAFLYYSESKCSPARAQASLLTASLLSSLAVLTHPLSLIFAGLVSLYFLSGFIRRKQKLNLAKFAFFTAPVISAALAVSLYNRVFASASFSIQENGAFNFYLGNNPDSDGTCYLRPGPDWDKVHREAEPSPSSSRGKDIYFLEKSYEFIVANPFSWLLLLLKKSFLSWNGKELVSGADYSIGRYYTSLQSGSFFASHLLMLFSVAGFFSTIFLRGKEVFQFRFFLLLFASFWIAQTVFVASGRYRFSALPASFALASFFISDLFYRLKHGESSKPHFSALALSSLFVLFPMQSDNSKEDAEAKSVIGEALIKKNRIEEGKNLINESLSILPLYSRNYNLLGIIAMKEGKLDEAENFFLKARNCDPHDPYSLMNMAILYSNRGDAKNAEINFDLAMKQGCPSSLLLFNYAFFLQNNGNPDKALELYTECIRIAPYSKKALNNSGTIAVSKNDFHSAERYFISALKLEPDNIRTLSNLAFVKSSLGKSDEAGRILKKIESMNVERLGPD